MPLVYAIIASVAGMLLFVLFWTPFVKLGWRGLLIVPTFVLLISLGVWLSNRFDPRLPVQRTRKVGLVAVWVKAKKDRYCPIVTLED